MMNGLQTIVPIPAYPFSIYHQDIGLCMGSCFVEHIGSRLQALQFSLTLNPFGIVYNPLVLAQLLSRLIEGRAVSEDELFEHQGLWRHQDFHSRYAHPDKAEAWSRMETQRQQASAILPQLKYFVITLGTAYAYRNKETQKWVNNCHRQAGNLFDKKRISIDAMTSELLVALAALRTINPDVQVLMTVSPVRHIRDGILENQRSKASLLLTVEEVCHQMESVHYFPSYEILQDELRDYRFYADDLIHPSKVAVDIIWSRFTNAFWDDDTEELVARLSKINTSLQHRPQYLERASTKSFYSRLRQEMAAIEAAYPFISYEEARLKLPI